MTALRAHVQTRVGGLHLDLDLAGDAAPLALVGPNGSGKTSLLRVLAGALEPEAGEIQVGERVLFSRERGIDVPMEARRIGYVPQGYGLFPHLRVLDNVAFGLAGRARGEPADARRQRARQMLERLGCAGLEDRLPRRLSGGEQQRVALARALVIEPSLLLLDEPLSALDAGARRQVRAFLAEHLHAAGCPTLVVTHDARDVQALGAHVAVLDRGRIVQRGDIETLRADPANEFVAELFGTCATLEVPMTRVG